MKKAVFISFVIMLAAAVARFSITLALARELPKAEVGLFNLVISLSFLLSALGLMGQHLSLVRFFSSRPLSQYRWKGALVRTFAVGSLLSLAGSLVAGAVYRFDALSLAACALLTLCVIVQEHCASLFRAQQRYYLSLALGQLLPVLFLALLLGLLLFAALSLKTVLVLYMALSLCVAVCSAWLTLAWLPSGAEELPREVRREGYLFFGIALSFVLFSQADVMLVAGLISLEGLAVYTVILSIMKLYDFAGMALNHVLVPRINRMTGRQLREAFASAALFGAAATACYLLWGDLAIRFLYRGEYNAGAMLIPIFCLAGILKLLYTIPSALIAATSPEEVMRKFLYVNVAAVALNYGANVCLISRFGVAGAAFGAALGWFFRVACAVALSGIVPRMRGAAQAAAAAGSGER